jgi:hypothetical protein
LSCQRSANDAAVVGHFGWQHRRCNADVW